MKIEEWAKAQNLSWEKVARELSLITMRLTRNPYTGAPGHALYSARLWRLRTGATKARPYELQALHELTRGDVTSFVEALEQGFPLLIDEGLDEAEHHCEYAIQRERKRVHSILAAWRGNDGEK